MHTSAPWRKEVLKSNVTIEVPNAIGKNENDIGRGRTLYGQQRVNESVGGRKENKTKHIK